MNHGWPKGKPRPGRYKRVRARKTENSEGTVYVSVNQASEFTGVSRTSISNCLNGWAKTAGGFLWSVEPYKSEESYGV